MRTTLICQLCKTMQADVYCIPMPGTMGEVMMCNHIVESVVRVQRLVEAEEDVESPKMACAA